MSSIAKFRSCSSLLFALLLLFVLPAAAEPEPAGQVIIATGVVQAFAVDGAERTLARRSPFFPGEIIRTAPDSEVQLRFTDGALMSLRENTELKVDEYRFRNQGGDGDRSMSTLIKGGLRTITGVIGKQDAAAYRVSTPVATIGVRGTHYEAVLESPESLVVAAWQGGIQVRNARGALDLGIGGDFNFGRVGTQQPPQGLLEPPAVLKAETPVGQRPASNPAPQQTQKPDRPQAPAAAPPQQDKAPAPMTESGPGTREGDLQENTAALPPPPPPGTMPLAGSVLQDPLMTTLDGSCATCAPPQQIIVNDSTNLPLSSDLRFTAAEWGALQTTPFLGVAVDVNNTAAFGFKGGRALNHGGSSPVITDNRYGPHEPQYATAPILDVLRRGAASVDAFASHAVDAQHTVYWGTWNGNVDPVEVQIDATNPAVKKQIYAPVHWATLLPTDKAVMAARTGSIALNTVVAAHGGGSGGGPLAPGNISFNANVNFDSGAITAGTLGINNGPENWNVNFAGQVRGNIFDVQVNNATSTVMVSPGPTQAVEGDIGMAFTGNSGQAVGGAFNFQAIGNPATHVEGILLVQ